MLPARRGNRYNVSDGGGLPYKQCSPKGRNAKNGREGCPETYLRSRPRNLDTETRGGKANTGKGWGERRRIGPGGVDGLVYKRPHMLG